MLTNGSLSSTKSPVGGGEYGRVLGNRTVAILGGDFLEGRTPRGEGLFFFSKEGGGARRVKRGEGFSRRRAEENFTSVS